MRAGDRAEVGAGKKRKEASVSELAGASVEKKKILPTWRTYVIPCEGVEVLKRKKEAMAACQLWRTMDVLGAMASDLWESIDVPGKLLELWLERQKANAEAAARKKRRKVLKSTVLNRLVQLMITSPYKCVDHNLSKEELAKLSVSNRQNYILRKFIDDKMINYKQTLIYQYVKQGYAEDETEVTDDDEEK